MDRWSGSKRDNLIMEEMGWEGEELGRRRDGWGGEEIFGMREDGWGVEDMVGRRGDN